MGEITTDEGVRELLARARTIAVLGVHDDRARPAFYVPDYLYAQGYRIVPVNPALAGKELFGEAVRARLADVGEPVDIVDVFRRSEAIPAHLDDLLAMKPLPRAVWLQLGIRNDEVAERLALAGIAVVQDRCTLADHRRLGIGRVG